MMLTALTIIANPNPPATTEVAESFVQRVGTGLGNLALGMIIVFSVLTILWLVVELVGKLFAKSDAKAAAKKKTEAVSAPVVEEAPVVAEDNDEELVAAITAAVALCLEAENGGEAPQFKVVSFRKTYSKQSWNN